ncbi:hypothetical protein [Microcoleus sp. B3-D7]|uniref:hypothetical protein n=1 Tax=Microcoleus sp. B3-D7 TaxID=2818659 RepID=UPI002FD56F23
MSVDPPPDLARKIALTSGTQFDNCHILGVPELGPYARRGLQINVLQTEQYIESDVSPTFPNISIVELVNQYTQPSQFAARTPSIQDFKVLIEENLYSQNFLPH